MNKCDCHNNCGAGYMPGPVPAKITLRTVVIPASLGTDTEGNAYAPKSGMYYNTVVLYQATGAVFLYDSNGVYTQIEPDNYAELVQKVEGLEAALTALQEKEQEDVENLQTNINQLANKEAEDVADLQTNINTEVNAREAADTEINQRIDDIINSPDVRYIESTYADLEAIDKSTIGDQDYARVLQDETHENASTYYQFNKANETWNYVGQTGPYYTKEQMDAALAGKQSTLVSSVNLKTLNNISLLGAGNIDIAGGGGVFYSDYGSSTTGGLTQAFLTNILGGQNVKIGGPVNVDYHNWSNNTGVELGYGAYVDATSSGTSANQAVAIGESAHVSETGNSTNATGVAIGAGAQAMGTANIALGRSAKSNERYSVAIGWQAQSDYTESVALGNKSQNSREQEISIGGGSSTFPQTRYLANVRAGVLDTDAVNVSQLKNGTPAEQIYSKAGTTDGLSVDLIYGVENARTSLTLAYVNILKVVKMGALVAVEFDFGLDGTNIQLGPHGTIEVFFNDLSTVLAVNFPHRQAVLNSTVAFGKTSQGETTSIASTGLCNVRLQRVGNDGNLWGLQLTPIGDTTWGDISMAFKGSTMFITHEY